MKAAKEESQCGLSMLPGSGSMPNSLRDQFKPPVKAALSLLLFNLRQANTVKSTSLLFFSVKRWPVLPKQSPAVQGAHGAGEFLPLHPPVSPTSAREIHTPDTKTRGRAQQRAACFPGFACLISRDMAGLGTEHMIVLSISTLWHRNTCLE